MKINTNDIFNICNVLNVFQTLSKFFQNEYKNFCRFYSNGDGNLYVIANNYEDMKIIQKIGIEIGVEINKIYIIGEIYNIVKNIINYSTFELQDNLIYFDDGRFSLISIDLSDTKIDEIYSLDKIEILDKSFGVDNDLESELKNIFNILTLKSDTINSYFYNDSNLFFNFKHIYVKKRSDLKFMITDIFSLKMLSIILLRNKGATVKYGVVNNKLVFNSEDFYIETSVFTEDKNTMNYLGNYFNSKKDISKISLKLEFFNFVEAINYFDDESTIIFDNHKIYVNSAYKKFIAEFNFTEFPDSFIISTDTFYKLLSYVKKYNTEDSINFKIIDSNGSKFVYFNINDTELISEVI